MQSSPRRLRGEIHTTTVLVVVALVTVAACSSDQPAVAPITSTPITIRTAPLSMSTTTTVSTTTSLSPATTTVSATTLVPAGTKPSNRVLTAEDPLRVMVVGDSVTYEIEPALSAALEHTGLVSSSNRTQVGFGLSRWPVYPWWEVWPPFLAEVNPEAVVFQTGIWDVNEVFYGDLRRPVPEDVDWTEQYVFLMEVAVEVLTADGAILFWQTMLPSTDPAPVERLNRLVGDLTGRDDRVILVDLTPGFTDSDGAYRRLVDRDGELWPLRKVDEVHLCRQGAEVAARITAEAIVSHFGLRLLDGWEDGPWRSDPRFDVDPCDDPTPPRGTP